jgi:hypothetical protein
VLELFTARLRQEEMRERIRTWSRTRPAPNAAIRPRPMHTHKAMMLEATPTLFRHLIATDLGAKNAVLGVGAFVPRARAPPQVRGGRDVRASRPLRTP